MYLWIIYPVWFSSTFFRPLLVSHCLFDYLILTTKQGSSDLEVKLNFQITLCLPWIVFRVPLRHACWLMASKGAGNHLETKHSERKLFDGYSDSVGNDFIRFLVSKTSISSIQMPYLATIRNYMIRAPKIPTIEKWCGQNHISFAVCSDTLRNGFNRFLMSKNLFLEYTPVLGTKYI